MRRAFPRLRRRPAFLRNVVDECLRFMRVSKKTLDCWVIVRILTAKAGWSHARRHRYPGVFAAPYDRPEAGKPGAFRRRGGPSGCFRLVHYMLDKNRPMVAGYACGGPTGFGPSFCIFNP
jgi:hypothetical protein